MGKDWLMEEYKRASARWEQLPVWARPVVTRPIVKSKESK